MTTRYYGIAPHETGSLFSASVKSKPGKLIAFATVNHLDRDGYQVHKLLRCIDKNIVHSKLSPTDLTHEQNILLPIDRLREAYAMYPDLVKRTETLIDQCEIRMESGF